MPETSGIELRYEGQKLEHSMVLCQICNRNQATFCYLENGQVKFLCADCAIESQVNPSSRFDK